MKGKLWVNWKQRIAMPLGYFVSITLDFILFLVLRFFLRMDVTIAHSLTTGLSIFLFYQLRRLANALAGVKISYAQYVRFLGFNAALAMATLFLVYVFNIVLEYNQIVTKLVNVAIMSLSNICISLYERSVTKNGQF
ncbi:MAG: hypothetical protein ACOX88_02570 [Christensenellales bacterium]|jgi:hypothetical protein